MGGVMVVFPWYQTEDVSAADMEVVNLNSRMIPKVQQQEMVTGTIHIIQLATIVCLTSLSNQSQWM